MDRYTRLHHHPGFDLQPIGGPSKLSLAIVDSEPACQVSDMPVWLSKGTAMVLKTLPAVEGRLLTETASLCCRLATAALLAFVEVLTANDKSLLNLWPLSCCMLTFNFCNWIGKLVIEFGM